MSYLCFNGFNVHYKDLLDQLPPSIKKDVWLRLTTRKNNPLTDEQASEIHPDVEELLTKEVNRYYKKKDRQRLKVDANTTSDGSNALSRLDGFEKQLEERETLLRQKENNIKASINSKVEEERKRLKDEYDTLKKNLHSEYEKVFADLKLSSYRVKQQLEENYQSRISSLNNALRMKDKKIGKMSSDIVFIKNAKEDLKKSADHKYRGLEDVIFAKDLKIIALNDQIVSLTPKNIFRDEAIEPNRFTSHKECEFWALKREDAKEFPNTRKKYSFRTRV
jgi:hypothetical protein